jgi:hypothetical protein
MSETSAAPQVWCVQVRVGPGPEGTGGRAGLSRGPRDDTFPLEPHWRAAGARAGEIDRALTDAAIAAWRHPAACPPLIGSGGRLVLSGSYLVSAEGAADFPGIVRQFGGRDVSLQVRMTGPWPPCSLPGIGIAQIRAGTRGPG